MSFVGGHLLTRSDTLGVSRMYHLASMQSATDRRYDANSRAARSAKTSL